MSNDLKTPENQPLTFEALRAANTARIPLYKNAHGRLAHITPPGAVPGSDWSPAQWFQAVAGELGEYGNIRKKFERGDYDPEHFRHRAMGELADIVIYLDILALQLGISLAEAVRYKFNLVSLHQDLDILL